MAGHVPTKRCNFCKTRFNSFAEEFCESLNRKGNSNSGSAPSFEMVQAPLNSLEIKNPPSQLWRTSKVAQVSFRFVWLRLAQNVIENARGHQAGRSVVIGRRHQGDQLCHGVLRAARRG